MRQHIAVSTLINKDDNYLFIRQNKVGGIYPNILHIPGGGLKLGKTPKEVNMRE